MAHSEGCRFLGGALPHLRPVYTSSRGHVLSVLETKRTARTSWCLYFCPFVCLRGQSFCPFSCPRLVKNNYFVLFVCLRGQTNLSFLSSRQKGQRGQVGVYTSVLLSVFEDKVFVLFAVLVGVKKYSTDKLSSRVLFVFSSLKKLWRATISKNHSSLWFRGTKFCGIHI